MDNSDQSQDDPITTSALNSHSTEVKITWNPYSSPVLLNTAPGNNSDSLLKTNLSVFNSSETTQIISESDTSTDDLKETDSLEVATYVTERTKFSSHPHHPSLPTTINSESNVIVTLQDSTTENVSTESHIETKPQESNAFYSSLNSAFTEASKNLESTEAVTLSNHAEIDNNMLTVAKDKNMVMITDQPEIAILHTTYSDTLPSEFNTDHYSTFQTDLPTVKSKNISILQESTTSRIVNVPSDHFVSLSPYTESLSPSDISGEVNNNMTIETSEKKILITDQSTLPYTLHSDIPSEFHTEKSSEFINLQESTTPRVSTAHLDRSVHAKSLDPSDVPYIPVSEGDRTVFTTSYDSVKTTEIGTTLSNIIDFHRTYPVFI
ncbi:hypothetical protein CEXT_219181 [Caerostris extrusa]|uniref:Uncharacterized protein n=1 Tax=Caerostris extrusa TaxID=172846 RepID=A0AAV4XLJ8_CAEEX|nr:hypothetical protein CEXT_219181 [Caerostris extrusa]